METDEGDVESIVLLIFALWWCFNRRWLRRPGVGHKKLYLGPAEIASNSSKDFSQGNKHDTFWHAGLPGYFYVLFLWAITVSDFRLLEIYKNLDLPLSSITFTVNSHADNHFFQYIYFFQVLYGIKSAFSIKILYMLKCFTIEFLLNVKHRYFCRLCKNYWITCCKHVTSHAIWLDEITKVMVLQEKSIKVKTLKK